ncbi:ATP-binding protein [Opitutus sp. ER46]|uniref:AAA family ATPase n=1 Tax=Opitutus sp. ER46 TaxID=2161864 RepID=UPI000D316845|nr:ATP-binding protein [Opitutus sp. ER46]PTX99001.1 ATPase [Opitutus sp. ER46]
MIAAVAFRNFKALRATSVSLGAFNLVVGPNGSGKTSLMESILRLRAFGVPPPANLPAAEPPAPGPSLEYRFDAPHETLIARVQCSSEDDVGRLALEPPDAAGWQELRQQWARIRGFTLDHTTMAQPPLAASGAELATDGANMAAVLTRIRREAPDLFSALTAEMLRITPEFRSLELDVRGDGHVELGLRLADDGLVTPSEMSQGMLYILGMLALAFDPRPPAVICMEDVDRGIHPRLLREIRDALYRLSYPQAFGLKRAPVQVVVTSHSPYFIDLFREHPEEVVITQKRGREAQFQRLTDRPDLPQLLQEGNLGDMWFSGILGGVPDEP